jgi:hypothetical protein
MLANSSPQLAWLAPQAQPTARSAPETVAAAAPMPAVPSADLQQLKDTSMGLAVLRQRVDQIAVQVAAGQQQMADEIAKLHAGEQDIQQKLAAQAPRASAAPVHRPVPLTPSGPTASAH